MRNFLTIVILFVLTGAASAATFEVGSGKTYSKISDVVTLVQPGDVVEIYPGTYTEVMRWQVDGTAISPITVRGVGATRPVIDAHGLNVNGVLPNPRAIMQFEGDYYVVENIELKNARNVDGNGAGIRIRGAYNVTVLHCLIHDCDMGMMSDSMNDLLVEHCEVHTNGDNSGYAHNFYLSGTNATVRFCEIYNAVGGQNFKSRLHYVELLYNYIHDADSKEIDLVDSQYNTTIPNSNALIVGNLVVKDPNAVNHGQYLIFGQDIGNAHDGTLYCYYNTFIATDTRNKFIWLNESQAKGIFAGNIFYGSDQITYDANTDFRIQADSKNNWVQTNAATPAGFTSTLKGTNPDFVDPVARDYHLNQTSQCVNTGLNFSLLQYVDGDGNTHNLNVAWEYMDKLQKVARMQDLAPDIGAYEYGTGSVTILIEPAVLFNAKIYEPFEQQITASGGISPYTYSIVSGYLPVGLSLNSLTGKIFGTPTETGFFNITVQVTDKNFVYNTKQYTMRVGDGTSGCGTCGNHDGSGSLIFVVLMMFTVIVLYVIKRQT